MQSNHFFAFIISLTLASLAASAQSTNNFPFSDDDEADFSYLPYWATPLSEPDEAVAGLTPVILSTRPVMVKMPSAELEETRLYRITEAGGYEYYYSDNEAVAQPKQEFKPITERTFYLETVRKGILSPEITYREFVRLAADDKRTLLDHGENIVRMKEGFEYMEANLICRTTPDGYQLVVANEEMHLRLSYSMSPPDNDSEAVGIKYLPSLRTPTQLVKLLTDPVNNHQITGHAYYKNINSVFEDISAKLSKE